MSQISFKRIQLITRIEDQRAAAGVMDSLEPGLERQVHETQVVQWDTRRALALSSLHRAEIPLSYIRSLVQRGNLAMARALIEEYKHSVSFNDRLTRCLLLVEAARIAFFESNWNKTLEKASEALALNAPPVTQLALFQIRANTHFEIGNFSQAALDIEETEQLGKIYPSAVSHFYAKTLSVRILARDRSPEIAQKSLNEIIHARISAKKVDLDVLLTYLRVQIDLNRMTAKSFALESIACYLIADAIGDKVYMALAEFDFQASQSKSVSDLMKHSEKLGNTYLRIEQMRNELSDMMPKSTSCVTILNSLGTWEGIGVNCELLSENSFKRVILYVSKFGVLAVLEKNQITTLVHHGQTSLALRALSNGKISKKEFFGAIWGKQMYVPRLHDTLISSLVHRLKKDLGIIVQVSKGSLELKKTLMIL